MDDKPDFAGVTFVDEKERIYFETARLGIQTSEFLRSPVGRYLHGRAKIQLEEAKAAALECNPDSFFGRRKLKKIQRSADCATAFIRWCANIIEDGLASEQELLEYRGR